MKTKQYIFYIIVLFITSCSKDFVDLQPTSLISGDQAYSTPNSVYALMASFYSRIRPYFEDQNFNSDALNYTWIWTDEAEGSYTWSSTATASTVSDGFGWWDYNLMHDLNDFISKIPTATITPDLITRYSAEAHFLRAYIYFSMVKRYGGVPLVTQVLTPGVDSLKVPRNTEQEVYDFVSEDLDTAISGLQAAYEDGSDKYRATKYAAYALKCRTMLYAASEAKYGTMQLNGLVGMPASQANAYWQKSYAAADSVIKSGMFSLYQGNSDPALNYQHLFDGTVDPSANNEIILAIAYALPDNAYGFDYYNEPQSFRVDYGNFTNPTVDMVEEYEYTDGSAGKLKVNDVNGNPIKYQNPADLFAGKDPRFFATILYPNAEWHANGDPQGSSIGLRRGIISGSDTLINEDVSKSYGSSPNNVSYIGKDGPSTTGDYTKTGFYIKKYMTESSSFVPDDGKTVTPGILFRYGETLLNFAEAAFELDNQPDALNAINQIRKRAAMPLRTSITLEEIRHERKVEMAFENQRYWDIRRWHIADKVLNNTPLHALFPYLVWGNNTSVANMPYIFKIVQIPNRPTRTFLVPTYYFSIGNSGANSYLTQNPGY